MTHIVHPYVHRLGVIRDWKSHWFGDKKKYKEFLKSDVLLREFLEKKLRDFYVSSIEMERNEKSLRIILKTSRPGMIIGRSGDGSKKLKDDVSKFIRKQKLLGAEEVKIDIEEIRSPESNAGIVSAMIREGLEKRFPFRRVLRQTIEKVMANRDVKGAKIIVSGRLGGAEMARKEEVKKGRIPLQTFRADIDFSSERAILPYGSIGIKVWIYKGEVFDKK
ncbi:MAG TPA: 30S ribosomal protein S3 [Candidatus Paceibacterota bacterium]|jgi:small subunit ribosomal protein S3|nr:30S ribosomal protein S3 [Parcubacteria group bacterium]MDP6119407.1 30S ribosomal protein S3 [Candidatus Paceibacterota bacterium]HJN62719.1 30S ribosomal protein S3 [Candidatus Paceibacterota bacterium]|tara:strand:+ start:6530 stop:7189 length:660 start_codon:yes stop_codon:yes gene_type:complete